MKKNIDSDSDEENDDSESEDDDDEDDDSYSFENDEEDEEIDETTWLILLKECHNFDNKFLFHFIINTLISKFLFSIHKSPFFFVFHIKKINKLTTICKTYELF